MNIPTFNKIDGDEGLTDWTMTVQLDGTSYMLHVYWADRVGAWYADLLSLDGEVIRQGYRIVANWPLFARLHSEEAPAGQLWCAWVGEGVPDVDRLALGDDATLIYLTAEDVEEVRESVETTEVTVARIVVA